MLPVKKVTDSLNNGGSTHTAPITKYVMAISHIAAPAITTTINNNRNDVKPTCASFACIVYQEARLLLHSEILIKPLN